MTDGSKPPTFALPHGVLDQTPNSLIVVAASGTGGDIFPFITLSQGLLERGHRVLMLVPQFHESIVLAAGVPCQTFGTHDEWRALLNDPDLWDERKGWGVIWSRLAPHLGALRQLLQQFSANDSCVVLSHPILIPMAALARSVRPDLRIVAGHLAPSNLCSSHDMLTAGSLRIPDWIPISWRQALWKLIHKGWINPVTLPSLNATRGQIGQPPVPHFFEHMLTAPSASLGFFPNWYAAVQPDWPQSFSEGEFVSTTAQGKVAFSPELEQFLSGGAPPIVFTPGTGHQHAARYFNTALKALKRLGRRGIFVTPHAAQLPDPLPSSVMWQAHAPFASLLPRVAAVVHHGGIGTTADAFRAGTPQLIVPFAYDQFDNGLRAKRLGVADVLQAKRLSVGRMQKRLAHLLVSHDVAQACRAIAQKMAQKHELPWLLDRIEAALFGAAASRG
ncbi:glycosyltransferase [Variovorax sp. KBW07]|uniref:glycosyltransferase n=1 Tax=Variovorax sp. KBW07 TaxID=2153358 RepID=UPI000F56C1FB|nr:nucleotide disphospho-sugar-binding domain-containing protein [Variovorax sp. KBW07]RQO46255.1 glycosyltransferase [Variovorax sp. KBW07]